VAVFCVGGRVSNTVRVRVAPFGVGVCGQGGMRLRVCERACFCSRPATRTRPACTCKRSSLVACKGNQITLHPHVRLRSLTRMHCMRSLMCTHTHTTTHPQTHGHAVQHTHTTTHPQTHGHAVQHTHTIHTQNAHARTRTHPQGGDEKVELTTASGADLGRLVLGLNAALLRRRTECGGTAVALSTPVRDLPWHP